MPKPDLKLVQQYQERRISHGSIGMKAVKDHSDAELLELAIKAAQAPQPNALSVCFVNLPPLDELTAYKVELEQAKIGKPAPAASTEATPKK